MILEKLDLKVADEVFIATTLLHRENPMRMDFTISEIVNRAESENLFGRLRPGVRVHASLHCVANKEPNPGTYRMLYETGKNRRRLLLSTDDVHPARTGKIFPDPDEVPAKYRPLIEWAKVRYGTGTAKSEKWLGGVFQFFGAGKELWRDEDPDEYVRRLREGWE